MNQADRANFDELLALERQLMDPIFRKDRERVSALLAEEFREFGSSGRVWIKAEMLTWLAEEPEHVAPVVEEFAILEIAMGVVLATYRAVGAGGAASLRSSIWRMRDRRWQMVFHQGTRDPSSGPQ